MFTVTFNAEKEPYIAVLDSEGHPGENNHTVLVVWNTVAVLNRPRGRLVKKVAIFQASAVLTAFNDIQEPLSLENEPSSLEKAPASILDTLRMVPALTYHEAYVPSASIWDVRAGSKPELETLLITQQQHRHLPINAVASARIRCSRLATPSARPAMIASLDFEVTPFAHFDILLNNATISLASKGQIEAMSPLEWPIRCRPRDIVTVLYKIRPPANIPEHSTSSASSPPHTISMLDMLLEATLVISANCQPDILMSWRSNLDFSAGQPEPHLTGASRPSTLFFPPKSSVPPTANAVTNISKPDHRSSLLAPNTPLNVSRPASIAIANAATSVPSPGGLTISFSVPPTVPMGQTFTMSLILTNHSSRPLKLILIPLAHRPPPNQSSTSTSSSSSIWDHKASSSHHQHRPTASSVSTSASSITSSTTIMDPSIRRSVQSKAHSEHRSSSPTHNAPAIMDDYTLYSLHQQQHHQYHQQQQQSQQSLSTMADTALVPLTTDLRLGPLPVGSCHEAGIKMAAFEPGVCRLDAVRVIDIDREKEAGVGHGVVVVRGDMLPEIVVRAEAEADTKGA